MSTITIAASDLSKDDISAIKNIVCRTKRVVENIQEIVEVAENVLEKVVKVAKCINQRKLKTLDEAQVACWPKEALSS